MNRINGSLPLTAPRGMRDLLPAETAEVGRVSARLLARFAAAGYSRVTTPAFEYAEVLERGLELDPRDLIRFVEPDTGEVALLRPDITPQVARIVATRLRDRPSPWRLSYAGTVIRRKRGRARPERQAMQAGVEHIGTPGLDADIEVMRLACDAVTSLGLNGAYLELGQVGLVRRALEAVPEPARAAVAEAMSRKDGGATERVAKAAGTKARDRNILVELLGLYGDLAVLTTAHKSLGRWAHPMLDELTRVSEHAPENVAVGVDLGEPRGRAYYTGVSFSLLARGPGEKLAAGGRYDDLVGRFGDAQPATGFALDVDHLRWALREADALPQRGPARFVYARTPDGMLDALRAAGAVVATLPAGRRDAMEYARAWGFDALITARGARRVSGDQRRALSAQEDEISALIAWARGED